MYGIIFWVLTTLFFISASAIITYGQYRDISSIPRNQTPRLLWICATVLLGTFLFYFYGVKFIMNPGS